MTGETHPFQVSVWVEGTEGSLLWDKPGWMEYARCITELRAKEVAVCLSLRHKRVAVARLQHDTQGLRFVNIAEYPEPELSPDGWTDKLADRGY